MKIKSEGGEKRNMVRKRAGIGGEETVREREKEGSGERERR